jgi:hypothetical protein
MVLVMRQAQMKALKNYTAQEFEARMVSHTRECWPEESERLGRENVLASIRKGIANAAKYGVESEYDVARYLNIMYALDHDFDSEKDRFPWVKEILTDPDLNGRVKMDRLCQLTSENLDSGTDQSTGG